MAVKTMVAQLLQLLLLLCTSCTLGEVVDFGWGYTSLEVRHNRASSLVKYDSLQVLQPSWSVSVASANDSSPWQMPASVLERLGFREMLWESHENSRHYGKTQLSWNTPLPDAFVGPVVLQLQTVDGMFQLSRPFVTLTPIPTLQDWANDIQVLDVFPSRVEYTAGEDIALSTNVRFPDDVDIEVRCTYAPLSQAAAEEELEVRYSDGSDNSFLVAGNDADINKYFSIDRSVTEDFNVVLEVTLHVQNTSHADAGLHECVMTLTEREMVGNAVKITTASMILPNATGQLPEFIHVDMDLAASTGDYTDLSVDDNPRGHPVDSSIVRTRTTNTDASSSYVMNIGTPNAIRCRVRSSPFAFAVLMLKDGSPSLDDDHLTLTQRQDWGQDLVYTIFSVQADHSGNYTCVAVNRDGCDQQTITVNTV